MSYYDKDEELITNDPNKKIRVRRINNVSKFDGQLDIDVTKYKHNHIYNDTLIAPRFGPEDANRVNRILKDINQKMCGRACVTAYYHILYFMRELMGDKLKLYVEIGVLFGGSMALMMQHPDDCYFVGIDTFNGYYKDDDNVNKTDEDPVSGVPIHIRIADHNIKLFNKYKHDYKLIKGKSCDEGVLEVLESIIRGKTIDLLLIDGDHSYEGLKNDFETYYKMVTVGGYIMIDNYSEHTWTDVKKYVDETDFSEYGYLMRTIYGLPKDEGVGACVILERIN